MHIMDNDLLKINEEIDIFNDDKINNNKLSENITFNNIFKELKVSLTFA